MHIIENFSTSNEAGVWEASPPVEPAIERLLVEVFGVEFHLLDVESGEIVHRAAQQPVQDLNRWTEVCRETVRRGRVELIDEEDPFLLLAIPLNCAWTGGGDTPGDANREAADADAGMAAVGVFLSRPIRSGEDVLPSARLLGLDVEGIDDWVSCQTPWSPEALLHVARLFFRRLADRRCVEDLQRDKEAHNRRIESLSRETQTLSENLSSTYEEISLLHRLTQNLKISEGEQQLGRLALEWLHEVVPARALALVLLSTDDAADMPSQQSREVNMLLTHGDCPVGVDELTRLIDYLNLGPHSQPFVANVAATSAQSWPCEKIRQVVIVPLTEGDNVFGWLAAINHVNGNEAAAATVAGEGGPVAADAVAAGAVAVGIGRGEFGTVEASLLSSVGAILGIHSGNIDLYRQRSEMFSGIVRALTSAIDAKDRYTHGHSDRVARISVRLAGELGCDEDMLETIYLAGLLHDIGKIGIDDQVLRKPGKLSDEEYEHIKSHAEVGHRILHGLKQMDEVLPVVLHHHESWDGRGYPRNLPDEQIPLAARIVAVADSYDAMSSDRPYRKGMPEDRIDRIFREGSGKQWDPQVVAAFFSARDAIREIAHDEQDAAISR